MAFTVSVAMTNVSFSLGVKILVLTGATEAGGASAGRNASPPNASLTPAASNSYIAWATFNESNSTSYTASASNTLLDNVATAGSTQAGDGWYSGAVTGGVAVTAGCSAPTGAATCLAAYEVKASGGSTPALASSTTLVNNSASPVTSGSINPAAGSVLVALIPCSPNVTTPPTVTDTSGLGLTWTNRAGFTDTASGSGAYVFTATVPGGGGPAAAVPRAQRGGLTRRRRWDRPQQPWPSPQVISTVTVTAGLATAAGTAQSPQFGTYITGISSDGTYFVDNHGNPRLFINEDTWGLIANSGAWGVPNYQTVLDTYFSQRAAQGYTAVEVSAFSYPGANTSWGAGSNGNGSDWDGTFPFTTTTNPSSGFNNTFWARRDYLFSSAAAHGFVVVMSVTSSWLDGSPTPVFCDSWTTTQWQAYGTGLGTRYQNIPNILWIVGDDYFGGIDANLNAFLTSLRAAGDTHPVSIQNYQESTSRYDLYTSTADPNVFGKNAQYDWVYWYGPAYRGIIAAIVNTPSATDVVQGRIPAVWGDGPYLNQGLAGMTPEHLVRNMIWWTISSGGCGFSTGDNAIWPWTSTAAATVTSDPFYTGVIPAISTALTGMTGWQKLRPDTSSVFVTAGRGTPATPLASGGGSSYENDTDRYVTCAYAADGTLAVIYCAGAFSITIDQTKMTAGYTATWVDPASGATSTATPGSTYNSTPKGSNSAGNTDWVLLLQGPTAVAAAAGLASGTGTAAAAVPAAGVNAAAATEAGAALSPAVSAGVNAVAATEAGAALNAAPAVAVNATAATEAGAALTPAVTVTASPLAGLASGAGAALNATASTTTSGSATATLASGAGTALNPAAAIGVPAAAATGTGTAQGATAAAAAAPAAILATGTGAAQGPAAAVTVTATLASGTGTAQGATASTTTAGTGAATAATGTGTAQGATIAAAVTAGLASGAGTALNASASTASAGTASAAAATGTGTAQGATVGITFTAAAAAASGTGAALGAVAASAASPAAVLAGGAGTAQNAAPAIGVNAALASATGTAQGATITATASPAAVLATGAGTALNATASTTTAGTANAAAATGTGTAASATSAIGAVATLASGAGTALNATVSTAAFTNAQAGLATGTGTARQPSLTLTSNATAVSAAGTGTTASAPAAGVNAAAASAAGTGRNATGQIGWVAAAGVAAGTGTAQSPAAVLVAAAQAAAAAGLGAALRATAKTVTYGTARQGTLAMAGAVAGQQAIPHAQDGQMPLPRAEGGTYP